MHHGPHPAPPAPGTALWHPLPPIACGLMPSLYAHRWLIGLIIVYSAAALWVVAHHLVIYDPWGVIAGLGATMLAGPVFTLCAYAMYVMAVIRPARLTRFLFQGVSGYLTRARLYHAAPVVMLFPIFAAAFTHLKVALPHLSPQLWDARLAAWDIALHGGVPPSTWLHAVTGHPFVIAVLTAAYHLWFFLLLAVLYWQVFSMEQPRLRMQFLLTFVLSWIVLGTIAAACLRSVGPCYYSQVVAGPSPYASLMAYLQQADQVIPVPSLHVQQLLWDGYMEVPGAASYGVSAMPSLHVASATLMALLARRLHRGAGIAFTLFAVLILIGSIQLGWHYAIDGYAGILGTIAIWKATGWLLARGGGRQPGTLA